MLWLNIVNTSVKRGNNVIPEHITVIALLAVHIGMLIQSIHGATTTKTTREMFVDKSRGIMHLMSMLCGLGALQL